MKRSSNNTSSVPDSGGGYQVASARKGSSSGAANSRLSSKRQPVTEESSPAVNDTDTNRRSNVTENPSSKTRQPVSAPTRSNKPNRPTASNPFAESSDEDEIVMPKATTNNNNNKKKAASEKNPFDTDSEEEEETKPNPRAAGKNVQTATKPTAKKNNPFDDDEDTEEDVQESKNFAIPNKPNRFAFYDATEAVKTANNSKPKVLVEPTVSKTVAAPAPPLKKNTKKNPFMDDSDSQGDDDIVITSFQKSKISSNTSNNIPVTTAPTPPPPPLSSRKQNNNPFMDSDEEEKEEEKQVMSYVHPPPKKTSYGYNEPIGKYQEPVDSYMPVSKTKATQVNPFMDSDNEEDEEEEEDFKPKPTKPGRTTTNTFQQYSDSVEYKQQRPITNKPPNNKSQSNPFDSDDASDIEQGMSDSPSTSKTSNKTKSNPFDLDNDDDDDDDDDYNMIPPKNTSRAISHASPEDNHTTTNAYQDAEREAEFIQKNSSKNCFLRFVFALCPRLAPLHPAMFIFLTLAIAIPAIGYVAAFTKIGYGSIVFYYLTELFKHQAWIFGFALAGYCILLYIFDVEYWTSRIGKWTRSMVLIILLLAIGTFLLFVSGDTPYGPIALFTVLVPIWLMILRNIFFRKVPTRVYVSWLGLPMFFVSIFICGAWILWTFQDDNNKWTLYIRLEDNQNLGCQPDFSNHDYCKAVDPISGVVLNEPCFYLEPPYTVIFPPNCRHTCANEVYSSCTSTFIIWVGPLLVTVSLFFLSFFTTFLRPDNNPNDIYKFARLWVFLLFAMWVAASLAGIAQGIITTLAALTLASMVASMILLINSTTKDEREARMNDLMTTVNEKFGDYFDIGRGLLVIVAAPIILLFLFLSCFVQFIRVINPLTCFCKPTRRDKNQHDEDYQYKCITTQADRQIRAFLQWDRVRVFKWAIYWGIAFISLNVLLSKFTVLFLAWLIEKLKESNLSLAAVTLIMIGVGLFLFLLPPVPGVPIYLSIGIIIPAVGGDILTLVGSVGYATGVCFAMRQISLAVQLKMGVCMKHFVSVRKLCAINTTVVRAATVILKDKWPTMAKCCALVGLPEWPMATMCGVLDLPLLSIQLASVPVILLIFPTVMTGTFLYMSSIVKSDGDPKYPSATTLAAILAVLTALVQFGSMVIAAYYVGQVMQTRTAEVDAIPIDEEVKASEEKDEENNRVYKEVTKWTNVPWFMKIMLIFSLILMMGSCYLVQLFQSHCFSDFTLTSSIKIDLKGEWTNIVKPLGALSIILFFLSCLLLIIFSMWASMITSRMKKGGMVENETTVAEPERKKRNKQVDVKSTANRSKVKKNAETAQGNNTNADDFNDEEDMEQPRPVTQSVKKNPFEEDSGSENDEKSKMSSFQKAKTSSNMGTSRDSDRGLDDDEEAPYTTSDYVNPPKRATYAYNSKDEEEEPDYNTYPSSSKSRNYTNNSYQEPAESKVPIPKANAAKKSNPFLESDDEDEYATAKAGAAASRASNKGRPNPFSESSDDSVEEKRIPIPRTTTGSKGKSNPFDSDNDSDSEQGMPVANTSKKTRTIPTAKVTKKATVNPFDDEDEEPSAYWRGK